MVGRGLGGGEGLSWAGVRPEGFYKALPGSLAFILRAPMSHQKVCIRGVAGSDLSSKMIPLAVEDANEVGKVLDEELGLYGRAGTGVRRVGCPGCLHSLRVSVSLPSVPLVSPWSWPCSLGGCCENLGQGSISQTHQGHQRSWKLIKMENPLHLLGIYAHFRLLTLIITHSVLALTSERVENFM